MFPNNGITYMPQAQKQANLKKNLNQNENKGMFISKFRSWNKTKHDTWETRIQQDFIIKKKQKYDKKTYPNFVLNRSKILRIPNFIYTHCAPNSINLQPTCGPRSPMCAYVWPMCDLCPPRVNYEWIKTQLKVNLKLIKIELKVK